MRSFPNRDSDGADKHPLNRGVQLADLELSRRLERAKGYTCLQFAQARRRLFPDSGATWMTYGGAYAVFEITGGREFAVDRLDVTGLDAALGISDERAKMVGLVKGELNPTEYFDIFRNSLLVRNDSHLVSRQGDFG